MSKPVAARGGGFGLDAELAMKANAKYDPVAEAATKNWIEAVVNERFDASKTYAENLKNGQFLCKLINAIKPGHIKKIEISAMPFKQMENITQFLKAARVLGVAEFDVFETVDLFDEKDMGSVVRCLLALSRAVQKTTPSFGGPFADIGGLVSMPAGTTPLEKAASATNYNSNSFHANNSNSNSSAGNNNPSKSSSPPPAVNANTVFSTFSNALSISAPTSASSPISLTKAPQVVSSPAPAYSGGVGSRGAGFGLDAELARKNQEKHDPKSEREAKEWIEAITGDTFGGVSFADRLKSGELLCKLINCIKPGTIAKVNASTMPFKQMENISVFLKACRTLGVAEHDLFETVDLYDEKDLNVVTLCLFALGRTIQVTVPEFSGPALGPKLASANSRNFTSEQLSSGKSVGTFISSGSSATMERTHISTANSITHGADNVGVGDVSSINKINLGSVNTMDRTEVKASSGITFGADAGKLPGK